MTKGMVISFPDKKILTYPRQSLTYLTANNKEAVGKHLSNGGYTVYPIRDGSIITLYTYNGRLSMSSGTSPDVSSILWNNDKSFAELFYDSASLHLTFAAAVNLQIDKNLLSWNIPENISVTFGMRNHCIHRLEDDPECIWLVHAMDMNTQRVITLDSLSSLDEDKPLTVQPSMHEMLHKCESALNVALFSHSENKFEYGYLLDSKTYRVVIPSTLYKVLKDTLYRKIVGIKNITKSNRYVYNILHTTLCRKDSTLSSISKLIPELAITVSSINTFLKDICNEVRLYVQSPKLVSDVNDIVVTIGDIIISNECDYNPLDHTTYDILPLYVYHPLYITELYCEYVKRNN
jgi:hypothetical protein